MRWLVVVAASALATGCSSGNKRSPSDPAPMIDAVKAALDRAVAATGAFPVAHVDRTPAEDCCAHPEHRCTPADFAGVAWVDAGKLPATFGFQLTYDSDGPTVSVHALGNQDCDDTFTDAELTGTITGKAVTWKLERNAMAD